MLGAESAGDFAIDIVSSALGFALAYGVKVWLSRRWGPRWKR